MKLYIILFFLLCRTHKMALAAKLNSLQECDEVLKVAMKELTSTNGYKIVAARRVDTRFNRPTILLEIDLEEGGHAVTFLPNRFVEALSDAELAEITAAKNYRVCCTGSRGSSPNVRIWAEQPIANITKTHKKIF